VTVQYTCLQEAPPVLAGLSINSFMLSGVTGTLRAFRALGCIRTQSIEPFAENVYQPYAY
jgi:hypothetical protein